MYESFYGFKEKPFSMLPDPGFLFLSKKHQAALTLLEYGLLNHVGFCVISGEAGAGKTTILRALLERIDDQVSVGLITNTHQSFGGLLDWVLSAFDLHRPNLSHVEMHQIFMEYLIEEYANNRTVLLIVDEAQNMKADALEELRMLSNVNSSKDQLMQVVLAGQPALKETLRKPELMQFAQRIAVDYHLEPLNLKETCGYIQHRLKKAGATHDVFTPAACERIYNYSGGTPRLINLLCETVLVYGFADQETSIDVKLIDEMVQERMKDSVVPICNRDAGEPDRDSIIELEKDFPWIKSGQEEEEDGETAIPADSPAPPVAETAGRPAAGTESHKKKIIESGLEPVSDTQSSKDEWPPLDTALSEENEPATLKGKVPGDSGKQRGAGPKHITGKTSNGTIADRGTGHAGGHTMSSNKKDAKAGVFKDAEKVISGQLPEGGSDNTNKKGRFVKFTLISVALLALLAGGAVWLGDSREGSRVDNAGNHPEIITDQVAPGDESLTRMKKLEEEAATLKRERDAALKKIEDERRAKAEAEKRAAEKAALAKKAAEEKRRLQEAERKRLAAIKEKERRAKRAAERAKWEAEQAKREAARLAEEKRLMELRLEEERRIKAEQEARRLELERLEQQRQAAAEAKARELAKQEELAARKAKKKLPADCTGPSARFKSGCR